MPKKMQDLTGRKFFRLTVVSFSHSKNYGKSRSYWWNCVCECGNKAVVTVGNLKSGNVMSCGCYFNEVIDSQRKTEEEKKQTRKKNKEIYRLDGRLKRDRDKYRSSEKGKATIKRIYERDKASGTTRERNNAYTKLPHVKAKRQERKKERKKTDKQYAIRLNLSNHTRKRLIRYRTNKKDSQEKLWGCTVSFFMKHIESQWKEGMTWDNYGYRGWHIDHIIPCSAFDLTKEEEQKKCFHYTNQQPLWAEENMKKGAKIL